MKSFISILVPVKGNVAPLDKKFEIAWSIWLLWVYMYITVVFFKNDNVQLELWAPIFLLTMAPMVRKYNDSDFLRETIGESASAKIFSLVIANCFWMLVEVGFSKTFAYNADMSNEFWIGQLGFIVLWAFSVPLILIKNLKVWLIYQLIIAIIVKLFIVTMQTVIF